MPTSVAVQPQRRASYDNLQARGKTKLEAFVAAVRGLLHAIYGMFKHYQFYGGAKVYASTRAVLTPAISNWQVASNKDVCSTREERASGD